MNPKMQIENLNFYYNELQAVKGVNFKIKEHQITALIGPSGCGKSTLLRCLNRLNDVISGTKVEGGILLDGINIYSPEMDVVELRRRVGMVFQRPNPFPMSIFDNVVYGPRVLGIKRRSTLEEVVERSLRDAVLWDEVKDNLRKSGLTLSGGQQQRLCIARLLAVEPEVILMDEPCGALDPISTIKIEELMRQLKTRYTLLIVTHNMQQAARVSDWTAYMLSGELIEYGLTSEIFTRPKDKRTEDYITGKLG